jgi:hypothetical protein
MKTDDMEQKGEPNVIRKEYVWTPKRKLNLEKKVLFANQLAKKMMDKAAKKNDMETYNMYQANIKTLNEDFQKQYPWLDMRDFIKP